MFSVNIQHFSDCSNAIPVMSTNVVAFILLYIHRDGCTMDELIETFDLIREELESRNKNIAFCGESIDIINHAVSNIIMSLNILLR